MLFFCQCWTCMPCPLQGYYNLTDLSTWWINCAFLLNSNMCLRAQVSAKYFSHSFLNHPRDNCLFACLCIFNLQSRWMHANCNQAWRISEARLSVSCVECFGLVFCLSSFMYFIREPKTWSQANMFVSLCLKRRLANVGVTTSARKKFFSWMFFLFFFNVLERSPFLKMFFLLLFFFNLIHLQELNKLILYVNPKS